MGRDVACNVSLSRRPKRCEQRFYGPLCLQQELPISHNLLTIHPNIKLPPYHVDVGRRIPLRSSVRPVRIAKGNVYSRILLVLQNLPNHVLQFDIRANRELAHAITILVGMGVAPEITLQVMVRGMSLNYAIALHPNSQRILSQTAKLGAKPITDDAINYKRPIDLARCRKDFSSRQVPPLIRADDPARLDPAIVRIQIRHQIGSSGRLRTDL